MSPAAGKRLAGVIGWPISHSLSPRLFDFWLKEYGIDGAMLPLAVKPEELEKTLRNLHKQGFSGVNLTLPHKEAALRLADEVSEDARLIGAVNAITVREDQSLFGFNTDHFGFIENIREYMPAFQASQNPCVVLGAGGGARAIVHALCMAGARDIRIVNRTKSRTQTLIDDFSRTHNQTKLSAHGWQQASQVIEDAGFLVNATQLGMTGQAPLEIDLKTLPKAAIVSDIVYRPLQTDLLNKARLSGHFVVDGLGMLLHQGRPGFEAWFGRPAKVTNALRAHMLEALVT